LELEDTVQSYTGSYNSQNFYSIYSFKDEINGKIMEIQNVNALNALGTQTDNGAFQVYTAPKPGVVVYYTDGYEDATVESLTEDMFDENKYKKVSLKDQKTVGTNVPVYKLITDENWNVIFQISDELAEKMKDDNTVEVLFKDDGNTIWAYYDIFKIGKESYLNLKFRTSVIRFANQRFIDIELLLDNASGLKIPNTAITTKDFLTVPINYFIQGKDSDAYGLLILDDKGKTSFVTPEIFYENDGYYYIDESEVAKGTVIQKPDSKDTYTINKTAKLKGVYSVNKGYAVFKQIDVLYQNEEYSILKKGTSYGLSLYDHIALEGDSVSENDLIH
ncbi:MAG: HlyD family efflux transporter periplasmic adaptor subunit, partial [Lachnospiraceae bacterium]